MWYPPQPVAFNLVEANRFRGRGVKRRRAIMAQLRRRDDGGLGPQNSRAVIDSLSDLSAAVLFGFTAIESLANHMIEMLDDDATITSKSTTIPKSEMVRIGIDDKLKTVPVKLDGGRRIAGTATWQRYLRLKNLRDELLHVKRRGYEPDPDDRTAYDRLIVGEADSCVEDAVATIEGAWPGFLPSHVVEALNGSPAPSG